MFDCDLPVVEASWNSFFGQLLLPMHRDPSWRLFFESVCAFFFFFTQENRLPLFYRTCCGVRNQVFDAHYPGVTIRAAC